VRVPASTLPTAPKPRLRGVLHQYAFFASLVGGAAFVLASEARARLAAAIFASTVVFMFGASALYNRGAWSPGVTRWLRRLDHSAIYLLIAGTYTPFGLLALRGAWQLVVLSVVWGGVGAAIVLKVVWPDSPRWLTAALGVALGWVGVVAFPLLLDAVGVFGVSMLVTGGVLYTVGSLVYVARRPDPVPAVFGFHEVFHALVVAAAGCQYAAVALVVL
jgi:hemolysin III